MAADININISKCEWFALARNGTVPGYVQTLANTGIESYFRGHRPRPHAAIAAARTRWQSNIEADRNTILSEVGYPKINRALITFGVILAISIALFVIGCMGAQWGKTFGWVAVGLAAARFGLHLSLIHFKQRKAELIAASVTAAVIITLGVLGGLGILQSKLTSGLVAGLSVVSLASTICVCIYRKKEIEEIFIRNLPDLFTRDPVSGRLLQPDNDQIIAYGQATVEAAAKAVDPLSSELNDAIRAPVSGSSSSAAGAASAQGSSGVRSAAAAASAAAAPAATSRGRQGPSTDTSGGARGASGSGGVRAASATLTGAAGGFASSAAAFAAASTGQSKPWWQFW